MSESHDIRFLFNLEKLSFSCVTRCIYLFNLFFEMCYYVQDIKWVRFCKAPLEKIESLIFKIFSSLLEARF